MLTVNNAFDFAVEICNLNEDDVPLDETINNNNNNDNNDK